MKRGPKGNDATGEYLARFTRREDALMARLKAMGGYVMPYRLAHWRAVIQDSEIYLNQLKCFVEDEERKYERIHTSHVPAK